jgi:uncharacterized protein YfaS (alpha-2-macroglobulin family)
MLKRLVRLACLIAFITLLYHLAPTMPSAAALEATATRTRRPTHPPTATRTLYPTWTQTLAPSPTATATPSPTPNIPQAMPDAAQDWQAFSPVAPIVLHFSYPMDIASVNGEPALMTFPWVEGEISWADDNTTLTFQPAELLKPGQSYHIYLSPKLLAANGEALAGETDWVLVAAYGPQVVKRTPQETMLAGRTLFTSLTFDRPMDAASVAAALSVQPTIPISLTWQKNTLAITSTQVLTPGLQLAFTLASSAFDLGGVPLDNDYSWTVSAKSFSAKAATLGARNATPLIAISFNYPMDHASVEAALKFDTVISGTLSWDGDSTIRMKPDNPADAWAITTISFVGELRDINGEVFPTLAPIIYIPPVPIRNASDEDHMIFLESVTETIRIEFLTPVDHTSAEAAFQIEPSAKGSFSWDKNTLAFQPIEPLLGGRQYTISFLPDLKTENGRLILQDTFMFYCHVDRGFYDSSLGYWGANIQVVDANGPRAIQFEQIRGANYHLSLYRFELADFIEKYRSYFKATNWNGREIPIIPSEGGELTAQWTWTPEQMNTRAILPELYIPPEVERGLYLLNMNDADGSSLGQLFVVLTNNNLMVKWAGDELLTWVSDINGASVPNIEVRLYSTNGEQIRTGQTDTDGIYRTTIPEGYQPMLMVARTDENDFAISGVDGIWGDYSRYWWWGSSNHPISKPYRAYACTDRPIYRPGQTVYFKSILRAEQDVKYTLPPAGTPLTVRVRDARDNIVQSFELNTNAFGSVNGEFQLSDGAMPGTYAIETVMDEISFRQDFKVEDYRKPEIQVSIVTNATQYVASDPLTITVQADYFFGEPVANAKITVKQYRLGKYDCWWGEDCPPDEWMWFRDESKIRYTGTTDANGQAVIPAIAEYDDQDYHWYDYYDPDTWYGNLSQRTWGLEVTVEDGSGQVVSNYTVIKVYNVAEKLKLSLTSGLKPTGKPFSVTVSVLTLDGSPVANRNLTLNLYQWNDKSYEYDTGIITPTQLTTGPDGLATTTITPPQSGYYKLNLSGLDSHGKAISYNQYIYAYSPGDTWATRYSRGEISISVDQNQVKPYDTVQLLIQSTFSGPAMLTFERGRVNRVKPITLTPPLTIVEVEVIPEDAPNIFVTVNAWQPVSFYPPEGVDSRDWYYDSTLSDSALRRASVELTVDNSEKALQVAIASDQPIYTPRQTATFTMTVTNAEGQPAEAELSLALVDEAIYSLSEELTPAIFDHFYGRRERSVYTYNSMAPYRIIYSAAGGGGGGDGPGISPRADFPDTAIWLPSITTDKNGVATVTVNLPDNLTTWRVVVRAATQSTLVGEATYKVITQQPVVIRPQLPRLLTMGDTVTLSAFIHNYTDTPLDLFASVQVSDPSLVISGTALVPVSLAAGEVKLVEWQATALDAGSPQATFAVFEIPVVENGRVAWTLGDAVQLPLTIQPLAVPEIVAETGSFEGEYDTIIALSPNALGQSTVRLELSRTVAGSLLEGLEYLTGYPYGCVEQTMSRALPNAVVGRAFEKLATGEVRRKETLEPLIRASVQRLYGYQHNDGGWGWWYDDATHDYQTAWVVFGLAVTADAGYEVDPKVIARGVEWLNKNLDQMDIRTRAYALYSMAVAGQGSIEAVQALDAAARTELDPFSQAALALAYHQLGEDDSARAILAVLADSAIQKDGQVFWRQSSNDGHYTSKTMSSTTRSTALVLDAFVQIDPQNALIPGAVAWLMDQRRPYGWGSTNETAYAILALTDYLQAVQESLGPTDLQIEINGSPLMTVTLAAQQPMVMADIPFDALQIGVNHLSVRQVSGDGVVYYRLIQRVYLPQTEVPAAGVVSVKREYLDAKSGQPISEIHAGDLVQVRLTVNLPQDGFYLIVEDHLPGGLEAVNEKLNNASHEMAFNADGYYDEFFYWESYGYNYKEIRADRVSFFITEMPKGKHVYTYLVRATRPGQFSALPAEIYAMYNESLWGRSASGKIAVLAE